MTALADNVNRPETKAEFNDDDVAAAVHIYYGALVSLDTSGNARPARATASDEVRGVAVQERDNSTGGAGDLTVRTKAGVFAFANSAGGDEITKADFMSTCYVVDDQTVAKTSSGGTRPPAGRVIRLEGDKVVVQVGSIQGADGDLVAANDLSDVNDAATARANIGANVAYLTRAGIALNANGTHYIPLPDGCTILEIHTAVEDNTTTTGAATITGQLDGTPITDGVVTIAIGAVVGEKDSATPSAANVATTENLELVVAANGQDAAATASVTVKISY